MQKKNKLKTMIKLLFIYLTIIIILFYILSIFSVLIIFILLPLTIIISFLVISINLFLMCLNYTKYIKSFLYFCINTFLIKVNLYITNIKVFIFYNTNNMGLIITITYLALRLIVIIFTYYSSN